MNQSVLNIESDIAIVLVFESDSVELEAEIQALDLVMDKKITSLIHDGEIRGKFGDVTVIHNFGNLSANKVLVIGAGKKNDLCCDKIRQLAAIALQHCRKCHARKIVIPLAGLPLWTQTNHERAAQALIEGAILGLYTFENYKSRQDESNVPLEQIIITEVDEMYSDEVKKGIQKAKILAEATNFARDLVNHPSNFMTPSILADRATYAAELSGLEITIFERNAMEREGMGALLAVAQGSAEHPKLIVLKYTGDSQAETIAFIGKGITFDSGGISIKPSEGMGEMKGDMAGAAAVIGAMLAIGKLRPRVNVLGIIPATENMPAGNALKPGDIITSMSGKTIEIITTDAEGRLILADAITYARQRGARKIIDVATLTGACLIALGTVTSGIVSNDREWCQAVLQAATLAGEKMWELPNYPEYKEQIKGVLADLKNSGGRPAGTITAGLFLREFAEDTPWVHIDIAGTASTDKPKGYHLKGATGVAVRTLAQLAINTES
jgi:leucyl aminopeptidase